MGLSTAHVLEKEVIRLRIVLPLDGHSVCHRSPFDSIGISMNDNKRPFNFIDRKIHHHKISATE